MPDPSITTNWVQDISSFGLIGAGAYLIWWLTQTLEKRQEASDRKFTESLTTIFNAIDKSADKYGDLLKTVGELVVCYQKHDDQAKAIKDIGEENQEKIEELIREFRNARNRGV